MKIYFNKNHSIIFIIVLIASVICFVLSQEHKTGSDAIIQQQQQSTFGVDKPPKLFDFTRFKSMFRKSYKSLIEELRRQKIFFARAIKAFLSLVGFRKGKRTTFLRVNEMSDWTEEERSKMNNKFERSSRRKRQIENNDVKGRSGNVITRTNLPDEVFVDHRKSNCFLPTKHQGHCGSCYAFSTIALYEWEYCRVFEKLIDFSEQYPIDCGIRFDLLGCNGGDGALLSEFFYYYGLETQKNYPYIKCKGSCPYDSRTKHEQMGYLLLNEESIFDDIEYSQIDDYIKTRPLVMSFKVSEEFHDYGHGVDLGDKCQSGGFNHSMLIVGSGRENGIEYWLVRNSYGPSWGIEGGYYKFAKEAKQCLNNDAEGMGWNLEVSDIFAGLNDDYDSGPVDRYRRLFLKRGN